MIGIKYAWKRFENICMKIKYSFHQCKDFLDQKLNPNPSSYKCDQNLMPRDQEAAPKAEEEHCNFCEKSEN